MTDVLIVGAGLSGLTAARALHAAGQSVRLLDKGRRVGGRCATRSFAGRSFDHGAQFFTVRTPSFRRLVDDWLADGLVREWSRGFPTGDGQVAADGHPRYCAVHGMRSIPEALAADLDIELETRVSHVELSGGDWRVVTDAGAEHRASRLVLTAPLPQSLALLPPDMREHLLTAAPGMHDVDYEPCLALLVALRESGPLSGPGGIRVDGPEVAWVADNHAKRGQVAPVEGGAAVTVHSTRAFAEAHLDAPLEESARRLVDAARPWLPGEIVDVHAHRWRYSKPVGFVGLPCVAVGDPPNLLLAGDCMQPPSRMEGAVLSGLAVSEHLTRG
jgi:renalase